MPQRRHSRLAAPDRAPDPHPQAASASERIAQLARRFLSLRSDEIDAAIREQLATAAGLAGVERASLITVGDAPAQGLSAYEWCAPGASADYPHHDPGVGRRFRWAAAKLSRGEILRVAVLAELPPEAASERDDLTRRGVRSTLVIPVFSGDRLVGYHVFESLRVERHWSDDEITLLALVSGIFAAAIERRKTEQALRESEERFRTITQYATELVAEFDTTGVYRFASPSYEAILGYRPRDLIGRRAEDFIHPEDFALLKASYGESHRPRGSFAGAYRFRHRDGSWRWMENSGRAFTTAGGEPRFLSLARDVTERREMEEALARELEVEQRVAALSRRFLPLTAEDIDGAIRGAIAEVADMAGADRSYLLSLVRDAAGHLPFYEWCAEGISPAAIHGPHPWSRSKALAGEILQITRLDDLPPEARPERQFLAGRGVRSLLGIPVFSGEKPVGYLTFESMRAERRWSPQQITLLRLVGELLSGALHRKRTEEALRESRSQLLQSQKLEAVGRLAGGIAHDFNNLLTVILGFSRALLRETGTDTEMQEDLKEIHDAAERAAALTRQLLTFGRRQLVVSQRVDLNATVAGLGQLLRRLLGEDVDLVVQLAPDAGCVVGDPHQLEQVIVNIAVNARDAMPGGGTLQISSERRVLAAAAAGRLGLRPGDYVVVSVEDSGCGMDDETRAHIFEPFFTTKEPGKGTGLGLSIVYSVVEQAGGAIAVEAERGKGTRLEIFLPRVEGEAVAGVSATRAPEAGRGEWVLLVEDELAVRRLAHRILTRGGYQVLEAANGAEALELADSHAGPIHLLLTDVVMPRMGGGELAQRLRAQRPDLRVLYVSGYPQERGEAASSPVPEGAFLQKPFSSTDLLARLRELLER